MIGLAGGIAGLTGASKVFAQQPTMVEVPATAANMARTTIHQELLLDGSAHEIYDILLQAKKFAAMTGMPAKIQPTEGGAFSTFGDLVSGRNIELIRDERIVQAWRPKSWDLARIIHHRFKRATLCVLRV
jgi:activator of HSP90 ATPase